jgi:N-acyl-D-amino-acid deacylase
MQRAIAAGLRTFAMSPVEQRRYEVALENTNFFDRWPTWQALMVAPLGERMAQMRDPALRARLRAEMQVDPLPVVALDWRRWSLGHSVSGRWRKFEGHSLPEIAAALGKEPLDAVLDLALDEGLATQFRVRDSRFPDEDVLMPLLRAPHMVPGMSDAGAHTVTQVDTGFPTRLLGYWARERQAISLEEAVAILAARPADEVGVTDRGRLLPGQAADLVLFDLSTVGDGAREFVRDVPGGGRRLVHRAHGVTAVFVNGVLTRQGDRDTGDLGGRVLRTRST